MLFWRCLLVILPLVAPAAVALGAQTQPYARATGTAQANEIQVVRSLLALADTQTDLGKLKVTIDKLIDSRVDERETVRMLDAMASAVRLSPDYGSTGDAKVRALRRYLYEPSAANDYQPFQYDLTDPLGHDIRNKLLSNYLNTRKGNCVTMPLLFVILGQRLGIDITAAIAPKHILVKFNSEEYGRWINLEATSGANPARDVWLRQQFPSITDEAIANGIYLQPLSKKEVAAVIVQTLAEFYYYQQQYDETIVVSSLVLEHYPKDVGAMTLNGAAYLRLLHKHFLDKYPSSDQIPVVEQGYFQFLAQNNTGWFNKAEALGWRQETEAQEGQYQQKVDRARQQNAPN